MVQETFKVIQSVPKHSVVYSIRMLRSIVNGLTDEAEQFDEINPGLTKLQVPTQIKTILKLLGFVFK